MSVYVWSVSQGGLILMSVYVWSVSQGGLILMSVSMCGLYHRVV